jgi:hypothetical protein
LKRLNLLRVIKGTRSTKYSKRSTITIPRETHDNTTSDTSTQRPTSNKTRKNYKRVKKKKQAARVI